jgi:hypothetical protein
MDTISVGTCSTTLILLFDSLPIIDSSRLIRNIEPIEQTETDVCVDIKTQLPSYLYASVSLDRYLVYLTGFSVPVPRYWLEFTADFADLTPKQRKSIDNHQAYIICTYAGDARQVTEQLISLYKIAHAFKDCGLVGVLDLDAWIYKTPKMVADILTKAMLKYFRQSICISLITNFLKIPREDGDMWFFTKGFHRLGGNDFAYRGRISENEFADGIFTSFFEILTYDDRINIGTGDRVLFEGGLEMITKNIYEKTDYLQSPQGTLVLEKFIDSN